MHANREMKGNQYWNPPSPDPSTVTVPASSGNCKCSKLWSLGSILDWLLPSPDWSVRREGRANGGSGRRDVSDQSTM